MCNIFFYYVKYEACKSKIWHAVFLYLFFQMKQIIKTWSWSLFKNLFNKINILNICLNDLKVLFFEKEWITNSNVLNYDSSYSNSIHDFIE